MEHVQNIVKVLNECWRVLKPSGRFGVAVPRFPHPRSVADPTHIRFFVPESFDYFCVPGKLSGLKHTFTRESVQVSDWEIVCKMRK
jgi:ubiquinone/menaquinone biosynthesis C-methylase UbiE